MDPTPRCDCGAPIEALTGLGVWHALFDLDVDRVCDLLSGELDHARCDAGCRLDIRASLAFGDTETARILVVAGDRVDPSLARSLVPANMAGTVEIVESADVLRHRVRTLIETRLRVFVPAITGGPDGNGDLDYLCNEWRKFTASVFAAVAVAMSGRVRFTRIFAVTDKGMDAVTAESRVVDAFAARQGGVWISLLMDWINGEGEGSFEADLRAYVDNMVLLNSAAENFVADIDRIPGLTDRDLASRDWVDFYRREALRASLYTRLGQPNPHADQWAYLWLSWEVRCRVSGRDADAPVPEVSVSVDRIHATVAPDNARFAGAELLNRAMQANQDLGDGHANELVQHVPQIFHDFGYGDQYTSILNGFEIQGPVEEVADQIVRFVRHSTGDRRDSVIYLAQASAGRLVRARRVDDLRRVTDAMRAGCPPEEAARITLWFWWRLYQMGKPQVLLDEIGSAPAAREATLPVAERAERTLLRVAALRETGRRLEALALLDTTPTEVLAQPTCRRMLAVTRARLTRESGAPAAALTMLETLLAEQGVEPEPQLHEALAATLMRFGRYDEATRHARNAYAASLRDRTRWPPERFAALAMQCQALDGHAPDDDLFDVVRQFEQQTDPYTLLIAVHALLSAEPAPPTGTTRREFVDRVVARAPAIADHADADRHFMIFHTALHVIALHAQTYRPRQALKKWMAALIRPYERFGLVPLDSCLYAAANLIRAGSRKSARPLLDKALELMTMELGMGTSFGLSVLAGSARSREINAVSTAVFADRRTTAADLRLVGELRRGVASRCARLDRAGQAGLPWQNKGLNNDVIATIAPDQGSVGVLEWITDGVCVRCLLTVVASDGSVTSTDVPMPEVDLERLGRRLRYRLSNWRSGRRGDPFGDAAWRTCQAWLARLINTHLGPEDHLVVIPFAGWWQLPWHVAALETVSCSYEPGWIALLDTATGPRRPDDWREGVATVPRVGDPAEVTEAMAAYVADVQRDDPLVVVESTAADRAAVEAMFATVDLATLLTHGYVSAAENEVALMLAAGGTLPLAHAVAADSEHGRRHRFGWREYAQLASAPWVILSAACGTGGSHIVGVGEHLGWYNILRLVGLRAFVAPRWDIVSADILPILSDIRRLLRQGTGLGRGVRTATLQALDRGTPPWSAYALTLEGDWR